MTLAKGIAIACFLVLPEAGAQPVPFHPEEAGRPGWFDIQLLSGQGSYLGVGLMELDADRAVELEMQSPSGVEISSVAADSPAEEGGLLKGDVILDFRGEAVAGVDHFVRLVRETPVGREVPVVVWRDGARTSLTVVIGRRSQARRGVYRLGLECKDGEDCHHPMFDFTLPNFDFDMPRPRMMLKSRVLGAELEGLQKNAQLAEFFGVEAGVLVRSVDPNSPASRSGLMAGDVIVSVDGEAVDTARKVSRQVRSARPDEAVSLEVMRNRVKKTLALEAARQGLGDSRSRGRRVRNRSSDRL